MSKVQLNVTRTGQALIDLVDVAGRAFINTKFYCKIGLNIFILSKRLQVEYI